MRSTLPMIAAATLLGACSYDFKNPAERLDAGEVTGRLLADFSGTGQLAPAPGVSVEVRNSTHSQTSRPNGSFFLLGLVSGRHTLLFTKDDGAGTVWALQRDIELGFGSDGQLEGVLLGDLQLRQSVALGGTFSPPTGVTIDPFPATPPVAMAIDEATGMQAAVTPEGGAWSPPYTGRFDYSLPVAPVGPHRIRFVISADVGGLRFTWAGGPITQNVPDSSQGQSLTLAPTALQYPGGATGKLRFRVATAPGAPAVTVRVTSLATSAEVDPTPDSTGGVELDLAEGAYAVYLDLGATAGVFQSPAAMNAIVVSGQTTELGAIYVVDTTAVNASWYACLSDADCDVVSVCVDGTCRMTQPY